MPHLKYIQVTGSALARHAGRLRAGALSVPCRLGRAGIVARKREGDGATPAGAWPLRCVFYRADRVPRPRTALDVYPIGAGDGWCDAPRDRCYNRPVALPYPASAEALWRDDHLYDLLVVLGHNDTPAQPGAGSCIFFHLTGAANGPTEGCVAVSRRNMQLILAKCGPRTRMIIDRQ